MLELRDVRKSFHKGTASEIVSLRRLTLSLAPGEFVTLIGNNGAGKSTLLNAIAGEFRIDAGTICLAGRDITRLPEHRRCRSIGRVFQNPLVGSAPSMTILENLAMASLRGRGSRWWCGINRGLRIRLTDAVASLDLGLEKRLDQPVALLSGGQRQALSLLMATLSERTDLLLLDEHCAALDPAMAAKVMALTARIVSERQLTTLMVTHRIPDAIAYGDRLIFMSAGEIVYTACGAVKAELTLEAIIQRFGGSGLADRVLLSSGQQAQ